MKYLNRVALASVERKVSSSITLIISRSVMVDFIPVTDSNRLYILVSIVIDRAHRHLSPQIFLHYLTGLNFCLPPVRITGADVLESRPT